MNTRIVYFDESGDDGYPNYSSSIFILTAIYMPIDSWKSNLAVLKSFRKEMYEKYGIEKNIEMHTKYFLTDKNPFRKYHWDKETKKNIAKEFYEIIAKLDVKIINVIIDKNNIKNEDYLVLDNALTYCLQRIENDSKGSWNYIAITDEGRLGAMMKTARRISKQNHIQSHYQTGTYNAPIKYLIGDVLSKKSSDSYFIQIADFISYFLNLYYSCVIQNNSLPSRVSEFIDKEFLESLFNYLKNENILNTKASRDNSFGFVIYPK